MNTDQKGVRKRATIFTSKFSRKFLNALDTQPSETKILMESAQDSGRKLGKFTVFGPEHFKNTS